MVISHRHEFIFIKTQKTAGTSVEIALSQFCGPDDVLTPLSPEDEAKRVALGYRGAQNYKIPLRRWTPGDFFRAGLSREWNSYFNHMPGVDIRRYVDPEVWNSYYKFCFERNPYDKMISWYYYAHREEPRPHISEFISSIYASRIGGFELYSEFSEIIVDRVYLYEELEAAMRDLGERLGLGEPLALPVTKAGFRKDHRSYRDILSEADREKISRVFAREIAYFGYEW